jgi:hypothetical protein
MLSADGPEAFPDAADSPEPLIEAGLLPASSAYEVLKLVKIKLITKMKMMPDA